MTIKPLKNTLFILPVEAEKSTKSGIIITKESPMPEKGTVTHAGELCKEVKVGDMVLFKKYVPAEIEIEGTTYLSIAEDDIMAIIEPSTS